MTLPNGRSLIDIPPTIFGGATETLIQNTQAPGFETRHFGNMGAEV